MALGDGNTASGQSATAIGRNNNASGTLSACIGYGCINSGAYSFVGGKYGHTNGNIGEFVWSSDASNLNQGSVQHRENIFWNRTTGSTAVRLTADGAAASATNVGALFSTGAIVFTVECIIHDETTYKVNTYTMGTGLITRATNAASTTMSAGNPAVAAGPNYSTAMTMQADPTVTADTTNAGFNISYTPPTSNTDVITAVCRVNGTETHN